MFCPKCGKSDQTAETYCRQCGVFLPDLSKPAKKGQTPADHVLANLVLNAMTVVASFTLAILLYTFVAFRADTHWLIYLTSGVLLAMGCWHTQTLWRSILLRRHFKNLRRESENQAELTGTGVSTDRHLSAPDFENVIPASVTDRTTRHLDETNLRSSQSKH